MKAKSAGFQSLNAAAGTLQSQSWLGRILWGRNPARHAMSDAPSNWRDFCPAILLLIVGVLGLAAATLSPTGKNGLYAVIAPPWYTLAETVTLIQRADGRIATMRATSSVVIVYSKKPGFGRELYRAGAWLVMDPGNLAGCGFVQAPVRTEPV